MIVLTETPDWKAVLTKLDHLERQNRRWRLVAMFSCALAALALFMVPAASQNDQESEVKAERFVLVDRSGKPRAILRTSDTSPQLTLLDENGRERVALSLGGLFLADAQGHVGTILGGAPPLLVFSDPNGQSVVMGVLVDGPRLKLGEEVELGALNGSEHGLAIRDVKGQPRAILAASTSGPTLTLSDENGVERAELAVVSQGPILGFADAKGQPLVGLGAAPDSTALVLQHANGRQGAVLSVAPSGVSSLMLANGYGNQSAWLHVPPQGKPVLALYDGLGGSRVLSAP